MNTDTKILNITLACDKRVLLNVTKLVVGIEDEIVEVAIEDEIVEEVAIEDEIVEEVAIEDEIVEEVAIEDEIVEEVAIEDEIVEVDDEDSEVPPFIFELIQSS